MDDRNVAIDHHLRPWQWLRVHLYFTGCGPLKTDAKLLRHREAAHSNLMLAGHRQDFFTLALSQKSDGRARLTFYEAQTGVVENDWTVKEEGRLVRLSHSCRNS